MVHDDFWMCTEHYKKDLTNKISSHTEIFIKPYTLYFKYNVIKILTVNCFL